VPCCGPTATGHDGRRGSSRWHHHPRPGRPAETSGRPTCWSAAGRSSHNVTYAGVRPGSVPNRPISVAGMIPPSPAGPGGIRERRRPLCRHWPDQRRPFQSA